MRLVTYIDAYKEKNKEPIELTHFFCIDKWEQKLPINNDLVVDVIYIGKCNTNGDLFLVKNKSSKEHHYTIYKGFLNDGVYQ